MLDIPKRRVADWTVLFFENDFIKAGVSFLAKPDVEPFKIPSCTNVPADSIGAFIDAVIAAACAAAGRIKAAMRQPAKTPSRTVDPLLFDAIVDELTDNRGDFPIAPQHSEWN